MFCCKDGSCIHWAHGFHLQGLQQNGGSHLLDREVQREPLTLISIKKEENGLKVNGNNASHISSSKERFDYAILVFVLLSVDVQVG